MTVSPSKNPPQLKKCHRCGQVLPTTQFNRNNQQSDGLTGNCKACLSIVRKEWNRKYNLSDKAKQVAERYRYSEKGQRVKKEYRQAYEMTEEQKARYRLAAKSHEQEQKYKERTKRYKESPKGKAMKAKKDRQYSLTEAGRFAKQKQAIRRKHQMRKTDCTLTRRQWAEIKERFSHSCAYCGRTMERLEMDHVMPLSKGGTHTAQNVVPACRTCNAKKGNKILAGAIVEAFGA